MQLAREKVVLGEDSVGHGAVLGSGPRDGQRGSYSHHVRCVMIVYLKR